MKTKNQASILFLALTLFVVKVNAREELELENYKKEAQSELQ
jgi:hypothetical protein